MACTVVEIIENGNVIRYFQCGHRLPNGELESPEDRWIRQSCEEQYHQMEAERIREATKLHDPNLCDSRKINERGVINLGRRANLIPSGFAKRRLK
jgi:hypothetical protein